MRNAITVDVEDYFHVSAFSKQVDSTSWQDFQPRVEHNTHRILDLFDEYQVTGTFFVLGWVAERFPLLVRAIADRGHEIGCHGYSHKLIFNQTVDEFRQETARAKTYLEDQIQHAVLGYRAASYSITNRSLWALDILVEHGFKYDSSIFPIYHDRYGIPNSPRWPHRIDTMNGGSLIEFPLSTLVLGKFLLPVAGGGYFRIYPYQLTRFALARINQKEQMPFIFYLHPWEIDQNQPRIRTSWISCFRHYINLSKCEMRLRKLMQDFTFVTANEVVDELSI